MKHIQMTLCTLVIWFFLLYNIERINEPINLASFVYFYSLLLCLALLLFRPFMRMQYYWLFLLSLPLYLLFKWVFGYTLLGQNLPITVTEVASLGLTIFLSRQLALELNEMGEAVTNLTINPLIKGIGSFDTAQSQIYREIRRSRGNKKVTSLLTVQVTVQSLKLNINRFMRDFESEIIQRYINARVGNMIVGKLHITDIISQRNNHFVILLPETGKEDTDIIIQRLQSVTKEKLGLTLKVGVATFPDDATTFEGLLEIAEEKMFHSLPESEPKPVNQENEAQESPKL
jgi:hypothetical protein